MEEAIQLARAVKESGLRKAAVVIFAIACATGLQAFGKLDASGTQYALLVSGALATFFGANYGEHKEKAKTSAESGGDHAS